MNKGEIQVRGILEGLSTSEILKRVHDSHSGASTSKECVSWYRAHIKNRKLSKVLLDVVDSYKRGPSMDEIEESLS